MGNGICANDFKNKREVDTINLNFVLSLSSLLQFLKPLSGSYVDNYAEVIMSNNDVYYIDEKSFEDISAAITNFKQ